LIVLRNIEFVGFEAYIFLQSWHIVAVIGVLKVLGSSGVVDLSGCNLLSVVLVLSTDRDVIVIGSAIISIPIARVASTGPFSALPTLSTPGRVFILSSHVVFGGIHCWET
jgi:hypothetical protein